MRTGAEPGRFRCTLLIYSDALHAKRRPNLGNPAGPARPDPAPVVPRGGVARPYPPREARVAVLSMLVPLIINVRARLARTERRRSYRDRPASETCPRNKGLREAWRGRTGPAKPKKVRDLWGSALNFDLFRLPIVTPIGGQASELIRSPEPSLDIHGLRTIRLDL